MPGFLLNFSSVVICAHGGQAKSTLPNSRVKVMGLPVLLLDSKAICVPTGTPLTVVLSQPRVKGM
ncbi:hypothetical protein [Nodularia sp. UHCC 0506]|uniref:hypothetical protein n=1 Tax=Nodularia sp. UHCC 0506 TaxID=3110243 RepID=UPI002B200A73|nr:hypothetical protein [Nodularia sp. UHCC 0506]MEA5513581.1 hypothetical protein [Nodularia sp. UHCC 0506]